MPKNYWTICAPRLWPIALSFFGICVLNLPAASNSLFTVHSWTVEDGLPQSSVISIAQTRDGYLWLGTGSGLARFDGLHFRTYEETDLPGLNGKIVRLFEDSHLNLWLGTENAGLFLIAHDGQVRSIPVAAGNVQGPLTAICEDPAGGIWLRFFNRQVFRYADGKARLLVENSTRLAAEASGLVWIGTPDDRLAGLGPIQASVSAAIAVPYEIPAPKLSFLLASKRGGYWRFIDGHIQKCTADHVDRDLGTFPWDASLPVLAACEDREGRLVVGTWGDGVYWFDAQDKADHVPGAARPVYLDADNGPGRKPLGWRGWRRASAGKTPKLWAFRRHRECRGEVRVQRLPGRALDWL